MRITAPDGTAVTGHYRDVGAWRPYRQHAMGVARETLDGALVERVRALPLDLREHARVVDLIVEHGVVTGVRFADRDARVHDLRARLVVGADGRASVVAERLGCRRPHALRRMALVTYVAGLESCRDLGEIFVDPPDYAILNPIAPDRVNLALVVPLAHAARWSDRLDDFMAARVRQLPHLARRLAGATRVAPIRALGPLAHRVEPPRAGGVLLVGDAGGFYDPFTGEGVFTALRSAELAVATIVRALRKRRRVGAGAGGVRAGAPRGVQRQGARDAGAAVPDPAPAPGQLCVSRPGPASGRARCAPWRVRRLRPAARAPCRAARLTLSGAAGRRPRRAAPP